MKTYVELLKEGLIDSKKLLFEKYHLLKINETECMVLLKLLTYSDKGKGILNIQNISKNMSLSVDELSNIIAKLVSRGLIALKVESNNGFTEEYILDDLYKALSYVLDDFQTKDENDQKSNNAKMLFRRLENLNKKSLTPLEIEIVRKWIYDYNYDMTLIEEVIDKIYKQKRPSINLVDRMLYSKSSNEITEEEINLAQRLLERKYGNK